MLLRRISQHVHDQNWFAVFIDFLIVVLGILIAFQITNWSEAQKTIDNEQQTLATLELDFAVLEEKLVERMNRSKRLRNECGELRELIRVGEEPKNQQATRVLVLSCFSTSWGVAPPASYSELMSAGELSKLTDASIRNVLIEYGQANALWRNVEGQVMAQKSEHSRFRQAVMPKLFDIDVEESAVEEILNYDWELMMQAEVSISTIVKMHYDQYNGHKRDLEAVRKILVELRSSTIN